jgi:hypothetical protein
MRGTRTLEHTVRKGEGQDGLSESHSLRHLPLRVLIISHTSAYLRPPKASDILARRNFHSADPI